MNRSEALKTAKATYKGKYELIQYILQVCYNSNLTHSIYKENESEIENSSGLTCPAIFDGLACWNETPAGLTAVQLCPGYIIGFDEKREAYKKCREDGTWSDQPKSSSEWTNYFNCVDLDDLHFRSWVNNIYVVGYAISVVALVISFSIFLYFRTLRCTRIRIHMNLFASFGLNNIMWIVWYKTVVNTAWVVHNNTIWCQVTHVITNYFMVTSYFWMFCEGLHLHLALVLVFMRDQLTMRWFAVIGWIIPLLIVGVYTAARIIAGATERCWTDDSHTFWVIIAPVVSSLLASFGFLINVVRVLLTKLFPHPPPYNLVSAKKATRASLILIPLFGLHFILIPIRPRHEAPYEHVYQVVSAILTSFQGLCVAILYCFTHNDVQTAVKTEIQKFRRTNDNLQMTGLTAGESALNTRENVV